MFTYPPTRRTETADTLFGTSVPDPYRWLEDGKSDEVKHWMHAQDDYARAELKKLPERDALAARLKELLYVDAIGAPHHRGKRYFYRERKAMEEKAVIFWREGKTGAAHVLLNPNDWSTDGSVSLGTWSVSHDGKLVAYAVHKNNSDEATLYVMDVASGKKLEKDTIEGAKYANPSWTPKGDGFYYTWVPTDRSIKDADRPGYAEVRFHKLGSDPKEDRIVRERTGDPTKFLSADLSRDGRFLFLYVEHGWTSTDVFFRDLRVHDAGGWKPLAEGKGAHYAVEAFRDRFYVLTDEGAPKKRVFAVSPDKAERANWNEVVHEAEDATIESLAVLGGKLALTWMKNATSRLEIRDLGGILVREVELPGLGTVTGPVGLPDDDEGYFSFESYTGLPTVFETSIKTGGRKVHSAVKVPFDASPYVTEQVFFPSKDGTRVSMFVLRRKDAAKDGSSRMMLTGYGGFLSNQTPLFNPTVLPWLERGGSYAVPNLRGGGEYGEEWHRGGMLLKKQNVFDDFIAAAEYLVREGYTRSDRLAISGGSNGGLLVGAAMTQRPDLFSAVLCAVPLLDMVRYHLSGGGKTWISEYGSSENEPQFRALYAYSPYHHVKESVHYPPLLVLSADSDDRVDPMHARKFAAEVQARSTGGPVLLRVERNSGHAGADLRRAEVEKGADRYAFALAHTRSD